MVGIAVGATDGLIVGAKDGPLVGASEAVTGSSNALKDSVATDPGWIQYVDTKK